MSDFSVCIEVSERSQVGEVRRAAAALARRLEFEELDAGRLALVVSEAASNLVKHSKQGEIVLTPTGFEEQRVVDVLALDRGPGMMDVSRSLEDGFSTAGSPGTGLGSISRQADDFDLYSLPGSGTVVWARVGKGADKKRRRSLLEVGAVNIPKPGEQVSGDGWAVKELSGRSLVMVVDGLGHGPEAAEAAAVALGVLEEYRGEAVVEVLEQVHEALRETRGAAMLVADIRPEEGVIRHAGIGNVRGLLVSGPERRELVSYDGTLGLQARHMRESVREWAPSSMLVLMTDGLTARAQLDTYPGLIVRPAPVVAGVLMRDYRRGTDDATVVVARARREA